ncbi:hypothetical protein N9L19_00780, partial [bacterium]|nr:hypothetical protein [bacterium]
MVMMVSMMKMKQMMIGHQKINMMMMYYQDLELCQMNANRTRQHREHVCLLDAPVPRASRAVMLMMMVKMVMMVLMMWLNKMMMSYPDVELCQIDAIRTRQHRGHVCLLDAPVPRASRAVMLMMLVNMVMMVLMMWLRKMMMSYPDLELCHMDAIRTGASSGTGVNFGRTYPPCTSSTDVDDDDYGHDGDDGVNVDDDYDETDD